MSKDSKWLDKFDQAVMDLAEMEGLRTVISIPGVWDLVADHYSAAAIDLMSQRGETSCD